jgi:hypothetical protein
MLKSMKPKTIKLPENFVNKLVNLPESGMGYQVVKIILRSGKVLHRQKVINSEYLMLDGTQDFLVNEIKTIDLEQS